jgi:hypothetical protein
MEMKAYDLTKAYPRSPKERLGGYSHLARMADKARAKAAGTLGEYIYPCPLDETLLEFLGITPDAFYEAVRERDDSGILKWLRENAQSRKPEETENWNRTFLNRKPGSQESLKRFLKIRNRISPHRTDITTWPDLLDLEEGREIPPRSGV